MQAGETGEVVAVFSQAYAAALEALTNMIENVVSTIGLAGVAGFGI